MRRTGLVVGAVIVDSLEVPRTVLAARRARPEALRGWWEFPGGKVEHGELPRDALVREIDEELRIRLRVGPEVVGEVPEGWPISGGLRLRLFLAEIADGDPVLGETHDRLTALTAGTLGSVQWLPSDRAALAAVTSILGGG